MAKYDPDWVRAYYDQYAEKEWQRWDKSPVERVKFEVHMHYLRRYLRASDRILEIGAGAGRFTQELAPIVGQIVVADISPIQLELNRDNARRLGFSEAIERWVECDMCALGPHFHDEEFDAVVCYGGPLSYVFDEREQALRELSRVTKPGGHLFLGVMSLWGSVHHFLPGVLQVDPEVNRKIIASGDLGPDTADVSGHFCHMYRAAEFRTLLKGAGLAVEVLSASDCLSATWAELLDTLQEDRDTWQHLLEMEIEACREPGCADMGTHLIAVCRKASMFRTTRYQGAIIRDHHILLIKHRHHSGGREYWVIPGGGREPGETAEGCVQREMKEETHLDVRVERLLLDEPEHPDGVYQWRKTYLCVPIAGRAQPGYEPEPDAAQAYAISEVAWFDLRDETTWDPLVVHDPFTYPQLQRIRAMLGYAADPGDLPRKE